MSIFVEPSSSEYVTYLKSKPYESIPIKLLVIYSYTLNDLPVEKKVTYIGLSSSFNCFCTISEIGQWSINHDNYDIDFSLLFSLKSGTTIDSSILQLDIPVETVCIKDVSFSIGFINKYDMLKSFYKTSDHNVLKNYIIECFDYEWRGENGNNVDFNILYKWFYCNCCSLEIKQDYKWEECYDHNLLYDLESMCISIEKMIYLL